MAAGTAAGVQNGCEFLGTAGRAGAAAFGGSGKSVTPVARPGARSGTINQILTYLDIAIGVSMR